MIDDPLVKEFDAIERQSRRRVRVAILLGIFGIVWGLSKVLSVHSAMHP